MAAGSDAARPKVTQSSSIRTNWARASMRVTGISSNPPAHVLCPRASAMLKQTPLQGPPRHTVCSSRSDALVREIPIPLCGASDKDQVSLRGRSALRRNQTTADRIPNEPSHFTYLEPLHQLGSMG